MGFNLLDKQIAGIDAPEPPRNDRRDANGISTEKLATVQIGLQTSGLKPSPVSGRSTLQQNGAIGTHASYFDRSFRRKL